MKKSEWNWDFLPNRFSEADMNIIPEPIFVKKLPFISWMKIYAREYGVGYSEMAILCLSPIASYHIPSPSVDQIVIPDGGNSAFYIDKNSWDKLVASLNKEYTSDTRKLEKYEKQFEIDGKSYLQIAKKINTSNLTKLTDKELLSLYQNYQDKLFRYSIFAWTSFILNDFVSKRATQIIDKYINKCNRTTDRQHILDSLFKPEKRAAILELQYKLDSFQGKLTSHEFNNLYENYKWLSCLDIHNKPWSKKEFREHIQSFKKTKTRTIKPFSEYAKDLAVSKSDLGYLTIANKFVYIKDARDDYRRRGVYLALPMFSEIAKRMGIKPDEITYLGEKEIVQFLSRKLKINPQIIKERKKGFVQYLDESNNLVCLEGNIVNTVLNKFHLVQKNIKVQKIQGMVACKGNALGKVVIVAGIKDLEKVKKGCILVAVTTHPDYVPAMRRAGAIITDEGGITSHAAIVSREFGIPCIVGTKNDTKVLKDGDMVKVDAINGAIRKL